MDHFAVHTRNHENRVLLTSHQIKNTGPMFTGNNKK